MSRQQQVAPLSECIAAYRNTLPPANVKGRTRALIPLAEFTKVRMNCVRRWLKGFALPQGLERIRLMCFLDCYGWTPSEYVGLPEATRRIGDLISFGILDEEGLSKALFMNGRIHLMRIVRGENALNAQRLKRLEEIWNAEQLALVAARKRVASGGKVAVASLGQGSEERVASTTHGTSTSSRLISTEKDAAHALAHLVNASIPLAQLLRDGRIEGRMLLRKLAGSGQGVFILNNLLTGLCSEKMREMQDAEQQQPATSSSRRTR